MMANMEIGMVAGAEAIGARDEVTKVMVDVEEKGLIIQAGASVDTQMQNGYVDEMESKLRYTQVMTFQVTFG